MLPAAVLLFGFRCVALLYCNKTTEQKPPLPQSPSARYQVKEFPPTTKWSPVSCHRATAGKKIMIWDNDPEGQCHSVKHRQVLRVYRKQLYRGKTAPLGAASYAIRQLAD